MLLKNKNIQATVIQNTNVTVYSTPFKTEIKQASSIGRTKKVCLEVSVIQISFTQEYLRLSQ